MFNCTNCGKLNIDKRNTLSKYCSNKCQKEFEYKQKVDLWLNGLEVGYTGKSKQLKKFVRNWLFETRGCKCEICGWNKKHPIDNKTLVEIDHIDGNAENCLPSNLKILCPNCHSLTPTFRARNTNSKRVR